MNIFKRFFNWVQSAPADFCYVTGEWAFKGKTSAKPAASINASRSANIPRSPVAFVPARVSVPVAAYDALLADLHIPEQDTRVYAQV